jgi:hypothetical protein
VNRYADEGPAIGTRRVDDLVGLRAQEGAWTRLDEASPDAHLATHFPWALANAEWPRADGSWRCYLTTDGVGDLRQAAFGAEQRQKLKGGLVVNSFMVGTEFVSSVTRARDATPTELRALLEAIRTDQDPGTLIQFSSLTASEIETVRAVVREAGWPCASASSDAGHYFDTSGSIADLTDGLDAKFRRNLRRDSRRLGDAHVVELESRPDLPEATSLEYLQRYIEMEAAGWKGRNLTDMDTVGREYYRCLIRSGANAGRIQWYSLLADDRPIAMYLCYRHHQTLWALKTSYVDDFASYSPGNLLLQRMLEHLCDNIDVRRLHMLTAPRWLTRWAPRSERYYRLRIFPSSLLGGALHIAERTLARWTARTSA